MWVVSTTKNFSKDTRNKASAYENDVRLIDQNELLTMLINAGFTSEMEFEK